MKVKSEREVAQLCPTLSDAMDYSLPGSSIHGIFQARVLEWGEDQTNTSYISQSMSIPSIFFYSSAHDVNKVNTVGGFLPCHSPLNHDGFSLCFL